METLDINSATLGSGGREAATSDALKTSLISGENYILGGNGGSHEYATAVKVPLNFPDCPELVQFLREKDIGLFVTGSEVQLCDGVADVVRNAGVPCVGASKAAALFEGDKAFATNFREKCNIPQAESGVFDSDDAMENLQAAREYGICLFRQGAAGVCPKFAGLKGGKGVKVCSTEERFLEDMGDIENMLKSDSSLQADRSIVVEEMLQGPEVSLTVLVGSDGHVKLSYSQDNKPVGRNAFGVKPTENTGGMGAVTIDLPQRLDDLITERILIPTIQGAEEIGRSMAGAVLYIGLMITEDGPKVLEYNMRMGDPETQVILPRYAGDIGELFYAHATDNLSGFDIADKRQHVATRIMAAIGYPGNYDHSVGAVIEGIEKANALNDVWVTIAGTSYNPDLNEYTVKGSRNLCVCAYGDTPEEAFAKSLGGVNMISSPGLFFSPDVGCNLSQIAELHKQYGGN